MTKPEIRSLEERVTRLNESQEPSLTTSESNMVRAFWIHLHWTPAEAEEYSRCKERMEAISAAAGSVYLNAEQNREYMKLSGRCTELIHDIGMKRVGANNALRDRVWSELAPRVLRFQKLTERPSEQLTGDEKRDLETLLEWFSELQREVLGQSKNQKSRETAGRSRDHTKS